MLINVINPTKYISSICKHLPKSTYLLRKTRFFYKVSLY